MIDALGNPQSVLLLGGTSDIGLAIVRAFDPARLHRVVLAGRSDTALQEAASSLSVPREAVDTPTLDVEVATSQDTAIEAAFGGGDIDVAVVAVGTLGEQAADENNPDAAARILKVNGADTAALCLRTFHRLAAQGHGTLVIISSIAAVRPRRANFIYGAGKAGLDAFAQGLIEMGREQGVDVVLVRPGFVRTRMTTGLEEAPFAVSAEEVARDTINAVRRKRSIVYSPAQVGAVAAALKVMPSPLLRRLPR
jgi:decaprenylphospho-beta-D-erythro-pentofuranosid-2-ulose 2-reductase